MPSGTVRFTACQLPMVSRYVLLIRKEFGDIHAADFDNRKPTQKKVEAQGDSFRRRPEEVVVE